MTSKMISTMEGKRERTRIQSINNTKRGDYVTLKNVAQGTRSDRATDLQAS